jgi:hypothetical protein
MSQALVLMAASRNNKKPVERLNDGGLNGITSTDFFSYAESAGFTLSLSCSAEATTD